MPPRNRCNGRINGRPVLVGFEKNGVNSPYTHSLVFCLEGACVYKVSTFVLK
jgi:hypothetical protein